MTVIIKSDSIQIGSFEGSQKLRVGRTVRKSSYYQLHRNYSQQLLLEISKVTNI